MTRRGRQPMHGPLADDRSGRRVAARDLLVSRHRGLVLSCVRQYSRGPELAEDLAQVGYVGLVKAINNFDPAFGCGLSSYARSYILGEIKRHFRDKRWQVNVDRSLQELVLQVREATGRLTQQLGRTPTDAELAGHLGVQKILILRFYGGMTQTQIGQQLGISQMQVSRLLARALGYLRPRVTGLPERPTDAARWQEPAEPAQIMDQDLDQALYRHGLLTLGRGAFSQSLPAG
jgi:RNA polymerase sigma factor (sigma-70 family)